MSPFLDWLSETTSRFSTAEAPARGGAGPPAFAPESARPFASGAFCFLLFFLFFLSFSFACGEACPCFRGAGAAIDSDPRARNIRRMIAVEKVFGK
jgi:hypothetical protein